MPDITLQQALELLTREVEDRFPADEVVEVYNELFPDDSRNWEDALKDAKPLARRIGAYINSGLAEEEVVGMWGLIFPRHRNIWYNEEDEQLHYEENEAVPTE